MTIPSISWTEFWQCDCDFFQSRGRCSHTMALEKILEGLKGIPEYVG